MTESVVSFLVERIGLFIEEEIKLQSGVREEIQFVRDELERMTVFLRMADAMEESNPQVGILVKQIRDVAFDMEDVLDEFQYHLAENGRKSFLSKLSNMTKVNHRRHIASQIQQIKSRILTISEGHQRYKDLLDQKSNCNITSTTSESNRRGDALLLDEDELVGIDNPRSQLLNWLLDEPAFKVVSIVGMGGLGKTTLVKNVYDNDAVRKHFNHRAWITVSKSFDVEQLLRDLIIQLFKEAMKPTPQGLETMKSQGLKEILKRFFQENKSLVVLDDVWNTEAWDAFKYAFPRAQNGNRLMLTTRYNEVGNAACAEFKGEVYCLEPLSFEVSWKLLCKKTFQEQECPPHLVSIAQTILERCKGLPLAIVAICGALARKNPNNANEWDRVNRSIGNELQGNKLQSVSSILLLSYYDLPFYLQSCLLYMSMLPEDYQISSGRLRGLWIAEGFVEEKDGMTKYEVAENYLMELQSRSLIKVKENITRGRVEACSIHDLLREILLSKSKDHVFATIVNQNSTRWHERIRRLSIHKIEEKLHDKKKISGLRSLLVFCSLEFSLKSVGGDIKLLRVLDLEGIKNLDVFPNENSNMHHLRLLNLTDTNVRQIPSSIGKLQYLEILLLKGTSVNVLPATIVNLKCLSELSVYKFDTHSKSGFGGISGMGCLTNLIKLVYVEVSSENGTIEELGKLKNMRLLGIVNLKTEDGIALCASIEKLTNLRELNVMSTGYGVLDLQNLSVPPPFLQRLYFHGRLEKIPHWITHLHNLIFLNLLDCYLGDGKSLLEPIQGLLNLESLFIRSGFQGDMLCFKAGGFQKLKELWVLYSEELRHVEVEKGAMPNLQRLTLDGCPNLENLPLGIEDLGKLKYVELVDVSDSLINRIDKAKGGEDFIRLQHVPEVRVFYYRDGILYPYPLSTY